MSTRPQYSSNLVNMSSMLSSKSPICNSNNKTIRVKNKTILCGFSAGEVENKMWCTVGPGWRKMLHQCCPWLLTCDVFHQRVLQLQIISPIETGSWSHLPSLEATTGTPRRTRVRYIRWSKQNCQQRKDAVQTQTHLLGWTVSKRRCLYESPCRGHFGFHCQRGQYQTPLPLPKKNWMLHMFWSLDTRITHGHDAVKASQQSYTSACWELWTF